MKEYNYKIESGIYPKYIIEYFTEISDESIENKEFTGDGWVVRLIENETRKHRLISLPSTNILFFGDKVICENLVCKFRMRFLSAGG